MVGLDLFWSVYLLTIGNVSSGVGDSQGRGGDREGGRDRKGENRM